MSAAAQSVIGYREADFSAWQRINWRYSSVVLAGCFSRLEVSHSYSQDFVLVDPKVLEMSNFT